MLCLTVLEKSLCFSQKMPGILHTPKGTDSVQHYLCTDLRIYIKSDQVGGGGNIFMNLHQKWSFGIWCLHQNWYFIVWNWEWIAVTCCTALRSYGYITEAFFLFPLAWCQQWPCFCTGDGYVDWLWKQDQVSAVNSFHLLVTWHGLACCRQGFLDHRLLLWQQKHVHLAVASGTCKSAAGPCLHFDPSSGLRFIRIKVC